MTQTIEKLNFDQQLAHTQNVYKQVRWTFYTIFALCGLIFILGLIWMNVIAIASGFISAMMFAMAYLGVIMVFDENIKELQNKINSNTKSIA